MLISLSDVFLFDNRKKMKTDNKIRLLNLVDWVNSNCNGCFSPCACWTICAGCCMFLANISIAFMARYACFYIFWRTQTAPLPRHLSLLQQVILLLGLVSLSPMLQRLAFGEGAGVVECGLPAWLSPTPRGISSS